MPHRLLPSIMSLCLLSCAGATHDRETVSPSRVAASAATSKPPSEEAKTSAAAPTKSDPKLQRDAKTSAAEFDEEEAPQDFSGVDVSAPVDSDTDEGMREVAVEGIEGTTSEFDVRTTLENRAADFDLCHDRMGGGGGRLVYRIHIQANGDVGGVNVRTIRSRNRKLVDCYTEVVASSHFPRPHGGYADVKWTTKVGRSRKRPNAFLERPHRWDMPAASSAKKQGRGRSRKGV